MTNNEATTTTQTAAVAEQGAQVAPEKAPSKKGASQKKVAPKGQKTAKAAQPKKEVAKAPKPKRVAKPKGEKANKKAQVIAMLQRKGGVTLDEIRKATGWQAHTVRGFISLLGSRAGLKIESSRRDDGVRVYEAAK